jgi:hypothetical protein
MKPESIMAAFETRGPLPRAALRAAGESREAMAPMFLDYIDRLLELDVEAADDDHAFTFIYHLLAEWCETRAYRPMARLLRRDPTFVDRLMGDGITECTARVMASLFDGDLEPILDAIRDEDADPFVRGQMLDALVILALDRPLLKQDVSDFLRAFHAEARETTTPDVVWSSWAFAIAALGPAEMAPLVRQVYDDGLIDPLDSDFAFFEKRLRETLAAGRPKWFREVGDRGRIVDTIAELSKWYCFSQLYLQSERRRELLGDSDPLASEPTFAHDRPKVGRNDPCPCGSGRKFKKCCLH